MSIAFQAESLQIVVVLSLCATLSSLMLTSELRRASKKRLGLRLGLSFIAILSLSLLGLESSRLTPTAPKKIALLTDAMKSEYLDSLIKLNAFEIFSLNPIEQATYIQDAGVLARNYSTSEIHIFGNGLNQSDLKRLRGRQIFYHKSESPKGIVELNAKQSPTLGEVLRVKGLVRGKFNHLEFRANDDAVDSLTNLNEETPFEFSFAPKQSGKLNLSLVLDGKEEKWGVFVTPPKPLSILVLQAKPTFEVKYLKNFLTENGYRFALRLLVGKDRYREEFWNMQSQTLAPLSRKILTHFDLVMIDGETVSSLSKSERLALENAVAQEGLGVFITQIDSVISQEPSLKFFQPFRFRMHQSREQSVSSKAIQFPPISLDASTIVPDFGVQSLLEDSDGRSVAAFHQKGFGRVAVSLVQNAYQWRLEGKSSVYASYWAHLFSAIAKRASETAITVSAICIVQEPIELRIQTEKKSPLFTVQERSQQSPLPLRQESLNPTAWRARYWAKDSGWIAFKIDDEEQHWVFISDETSFESLRKETRRKETMKAVQQNRVEAQEAEKQNLEPKSSRKSERDPMATFLCALCLMLAMGGLWVERKV